MPDNIFQPTLSDPGAYTRVQAPVQDNVTNQALELATRVGVAAAKRSAVNDLLGGPATPDEAAGQANSAAEQGVIAAPVDEVSQEMALESIDSLAKLSRARQSGLGLDQARGRARAILARSVNDNPLFADDIRKAYQSYFGGGGGGAGLFAPTPEEKADNDFRQNVQLLSRELQIAPQDAADRIRTQKQGEERLRDIELHAAERNITGDEYNGFHSLAFIQSGSAVRADIQADILANGELTPERKQFYLNQVEAGIENVQTRATDLLRNDEGQLVFGTVDREGLAAAQSQVDNYRNQMRLYIENNDLQTIVTANREIADAAHRTALVNNFGVQLAMMEIGGRDAGELVIQAMLKNEPYVKVAAENPFMASVLQGLGNYEDAYANIIGQGMGSLLGVSQNTYGARQKQVEQAGIIAAMSGSDGARLLGHVANQEETTAALGKFKEAFAAVPESILVMRSPQYRAQVTADPAKYTPFVEAAIDGTIRGLKGLSIIDSSDGNPNLRITQEVTAGILGGQTPSPTGQGIVPNFVLTGNGASGIVNARFKEALEIASRYPEVWQGEFENVGDYLRSKFGQQPEGGNEE